MGVRLARPLLHICIHQRHQLLAGNQRQAPHQLITTTYFPRTRLEEFANNFNVWHGIDWISPVGILVRGHFSVSRYLMHATSRPEALRQRSLHTEVIVNLPIFMEISTTMKLTKIKV